MHLYNGGQSKHGLCVVIRGRASKRGVNVFHLLCASTSALSLFMSKNVSVFPRVNRDARRTSDQRQSNVRHTYSTRSKFVVFSLTEVCSNHTYMAHSPRMKKNKN